jgi:WD40 repeat protein
MVSPNIEKLKAVKDISQPEIIFAMARVPNSARFYFGGSDFKVYDIDLAKDKPEAKELGAHTSYVTGIAWAVTSVVSGSYDGNLIWWDTESRKQIRKVEAHKRWIRCVASHGKKVASVADDMVCRLWDSETGKMLQELKGHEEKTPHHFPSMLYACAFSPDGKQVATADKVGHIVVWEASTGKKLSTLEAPVMYTWDPTQRRHSIGGIRSLAFSADGKLLAVGGIGKIGNIDHLEGKARVEVFDWAKGERTHEFPGDKFNGLVEHLYFHPQGSWLLAAGGANDGFLMFFNLMDKKVLRQEKAAMVIHTFALNEAQDTIYTAGHQKFQIFEMKG